MTLQAESELAMQTLSSIGEPPIDELQPVLKKGIHLRWTFGPNKSFPWYGYYVFRRESAPKTLTTCFSNYFTESNLSVAVGAPSAFPISLVANDYLTPVGTIKSDTHLYFTNDFPIVGKGEADLRGRESLTFTTAEVANYIQCQIGFRGIDDRNIRCVEWMESDKGQGRNPREKDDVVFTTYDSKGNQNSTTRIISTAHGLGLDVSNRTRVKLPCRSDRVVVKTVGSGGMARVLAYDENNVVADESVLTAGEVGPLETNLRGSRITVIVVDAPQNEVTLISLCYRCEDEGRNPNERLTVSYWSGPTMVHQEQVEGSPGDIKTSEFTADSLSAVVVDGADAAVVEVCFESVISLSKSGWEPLPECPQPLSLPVRDTNYPASGSLPTSLVQSRNDAITRIHYGIPDEWAPSFGELHDTLHELVEQGPSGPEMRDFGSYDVPPEGPIVDLNPTLSQLQSVPLLLIASLEPPIAQMLGLYWIDQTVEDSKLYDYLLVADHKNIGNGEATSVLSWLTGSMGNFEDIDAWICFNRTLAAEEPLAPPSGVRTYALPGGVVDSVDFSSRDLSNNVGLTWDIALTDSGTLEKGEAVRYIIRRASVGNVEPSTAVDPAVHDPLLEFPKVVSLPSQASTNTTGPSDWPNIRFNHIDAGLKEGWYSYRISGIDLFGRYSQISDPAKWYQWTPKPIPEPWYYDDLIGDGPVNPHAIHLLDKIPPPAPTAVFATALDPSDPNVLRDAPFVNWFSSLDPSEQEATIGLRVNWLWTSFEMRKAPDTSEFRVYLHPGQPNVLRGMIVSVTPAEEISVVVTDIASTAVQNVLVGTYLRSDRRSYPVFANDGSPLEVTVENLGPDDSIVPEVGNAFTITIPHGHSMRVGLTEATEWAERIWVVRYEDSVVEAVIPARLSGADEAYLEGEGAQVSGSLVTLPAVTDLSELEPFDTHLYLSEDSAQKIYRIVAVDPDSGTIEVNGSPNLASSDSGWEVGTLARKYELFLPYDGDADREVPGLSTTLEGPIGYAQIGVTAVDDKVHTSDDPKRTGKRWGDRTGNESQIGGPSTVVVVHRTPPPAPETPADSDAVYASRADYHAKSYYTFRWVPMPGVETHVYRSLDNSLFKRDWIIRETRSSLDPVQHAGYFLEAWDLTQRSAIASELNAIAGLSDYSGLSTEGTQMLARLPGNENSRGIEELVEGDWLLRRTRIALADSDTQFFPTEWSIAKKFQAAEMLNGVESPEQYDALSNDALRVLAGLPGLERIFQQVTRRPLPNVGSLTENRLGPDNPQDYGIDPDLKAYVFELDGRASNRYFFRAAFVDRAGNLGEMSISTPPVYLRDTRGPRAPVFTRVVAGGLDVSEPGDEKITLRWSSNREADLESYIVYRADKKPTGGSLQGMEIVSEIPVSDTPTDRPAEVAWVDETVTGLITYYYGLQAVDNEGNRSMLSNIVSARAFDQGLPNTPILGLSWVADKVHISWNSAHMVRVQRREENQWIDITSWLSPGSQSIEDRFAILESDNVYRSFVRKDSGAIAISGEFLLPPPI